MLYTLSGAPREAFERFGQPRATSLFGPTFRGDGPVRCDDVLKDPRYGKMAPHHGMPKGHLPGAQLPGGAGDIALRRGHRRTFFRPSRRRAFSPTAASALSWAWLRRPPSRSTTRASTKQRKGGRGAQAPAGERTRGARRSRARERDEGRISRHALARAAHAAQRHPRLVAGPAPRHHERSRPAPGPRDHRAQRARADAAHRRPAGHEPDHFGQGAPGHSAGGAGVVHRSCDGDGETCGRCKRHSAGESCSTPAAGPISGDPNRLQQVVWNLLSNAIKFTPKGGKVQVAAGTRELAHRDQRGGHRHRHQARVLCRTCSSASARPMRRPRAGTAAWAWGCRSSSTWSSCTAERCGLKVLERTAEQPLR